MSTHQKAWLALVSGAIIISTSPIVVKLTDIPGTSSAFYRVFIGCISLLPWLLIRRPVIPQGKAMWGVIAAGAFFAIDLVFWNESLMQAPAATASLLANSAPLWVGLGASYLFREQLTRRYWIGLSVALAGMVIVAQNAFAVTPQDIPGMLLAMGASVCYAGYILSTRHARGGVDTATFMIWSLAIASLIILPIALVLGKPLWGFSQLSWGYLIFLGIFTQTLGWLAINYALGHLPAPVTSVVLLGQVVLAALLAVPILGEPISTSQIIGGLFILGGIYIVNRRTAS
ncbi:MAG: DMT family transporter [Roseiflexaceae bacterium]|jgi:drug/metabolite transporter (DMT)-like permease|nr:DMT family transporter [Chloroflexaceae bacterium]